MRDRSEQILRIACLTLAALVVLQLVLAGFEINPLAGVKIPALPTLATNANSPVSSATKLKPATTNPAANTVGTNKTATSISTNSVMAQKSAGTNLVSTNAISETATNTHPVAGVEIPVAPTPEINAKSNASSAPVLKTQSTNLSDVAEATNKMFTSTGSSSNSLAAKIEAATNLVSTNVVVKTAATHIQTAGTNPVVAGAAGISRNNLPPQMAMAGGMRIRGGSMMPGMPGMPGNAPKLPPAIQARVDKIVSSEILAPVMHPMPMGLLGIAGDTAFLRSASGQTGVVKAGDSLGDLKLLKIGVNRVLVEENGQKQELMIFNGYGGDSLLTNQDEISK